MIEASLESFNKSIIRKVNKEMSLVSVSLVKAGFSDQNIDCILGGDDKINVGSCGQADGVVAGKEDSIYILMLLNGGLVLGLLAWVGMLSFRGY